MKAIISVNTKSHKGGEMYVADVQTMQEGINYFQENIGFIMKQANRKTIESVTTYVNDNYNIVYSMNYHK